MTRSYRNTMMHAGFFVLVLTAVAPAAEIHDAAIDGKLNKVEQLLKNGVDPNLSDGSGTPLQWALFGNQIPVARVLLKHGADPNADGPTGRPIVMAAIQGNAEFVQLLLEHGADPNGDGQSTPLQQVAAKGTANILDLLLKHGADPNLANSEGMTPLHEAAKNGHLSVARALVAQGADVNALTGIGKPAIHFAHLHDHTDIANFLIESGWMPQKVETVIDLLANANLERGESITKRDCAETCHSLQDGKASAGPSLWGVVGKQMASTDGYSYSPALAGQEGVWTFDALNRFLAKPFETIPGTKMNFAGLPNRQERADMIAYLRTLSDSPVPLP